MNMIIAISIFCSWYWSGERGLRERTEKFARGGWDGRELGQSRSLVLRMDTPGRSRSFSRNGHDTQRAGPE